MVKAKREYIFGTAFLSGTAVILTLVSLLTSNWIVGDAKYVAEGLGEDEATSFINYGLFNGIIEDFVAGAKNYEIILTCELSENICAFLCGNSSELRHQQLTDLYNGVEIEFDQQCPKVQRAMTSFLKSEEGKDGGTRVFINYGIWITTIASIILSEVYGVTSTVISIWNSAGNPRHAVFSLKGVIIFNGFAAFFTLLGLIMFIVEYATRISDNLMILNTITAVISTKRSIMGYSFWIVLIAFLLYIGSIGLLYLREYLLEKQPPMKIDIEAVNENIILF